MKLTPWIVACAAALLIIAAPAQAEPASLISQKDTNFDGRVEFVLENAFVRVTIDPSVGAMVRSYVDKKTGQELVYPSTKEVGGWFNDYPIRNKAEHDYAQADFDASVEVDKPDVARIRAAARGPGHITAWLQISKTYELRRDSPILHVKYRIENLEGSMRPIDFGYRIRNRVGAPDKAASMYLPLKQGVKALACGQRFTTKSLIDHDPVDSWMAYLIEDGPGVVFKLDNYAQLMAMYTWTTPNMQTMEFMTYPLPLEHGKSVDLHFTVYPVHALPRVDGATANQAGGIELFEDSPAVGDRVRGRIHLAGPAGDQDVQPAVSIDAGNADGQPSGPIDVDDSGRFSFQVQAPGTYVIRTRAGGLSMERPIVVGDGELAYQARPAGKRLGPADMTFDKLKSIREASATPAMRSLDLSVEGPHVDWASPYFRRAPRVLFLADSSFHVGREVVELAQAFDIDLDWVHMVKSHWKNPTYEAQIKWNRDYSQKYLMDKLKTQPYDAIVVALNHETARHLTEPVLDQLRRRRDSGVGMVWIAPDGEVLKDRFSDLAPSTGTTHDASPWQAGPQPHYLNRALPYEAFVYGRPIAGKQVLRGQPVIVSPSDNADEPAAAIMVANDTGRYREVAVNWNRSDCRATIFTPDVSPYGKGNRFDDAFARFGLKDYHYLMLGKAVLWAAHHEPNLQITELTAEPDAVNLAVNNQAHAGPARIEAQVVDPLGRVAQTVHRDVRIPHGPSRFELRLEAPQLAGLHVVNLFINDGPRRLEFGATTFKVRSNLPAVSLELAKATVAADEPVEVTARFDAPLDQAVKAEWRLVDAHGRLIHRQSVDLAPGSRTLSYVRDDPQLSSRSATVWLWLNPGQGPRVVASRFFVHVPAYRHAEGFTFMLDGYTESTLRGPLFYRVLKEAGVNRLQSGRDDGDSIKAAHDFEMTLSPFIWYSWSKPSGKWDQIIKRYNRTRDKRDLVRWVNLESPQTKADSDEAAHRLVERGRQLGASSFGYVDEFRYSDRGDDLCFSDLAMQNMRRWLKDRYGSLDRLNEVWTRQYTAWDQPIPDLLSEARKRGVLSSWADHRRYNEYRYNQWIQRQRQIMQAACPGADLLVSGTFRIHPWAATGPWQQATHFDGMDGYAFPFIREAQRSFMGQRDIYSYWLGYETSGDYAVKWFWSYVLHEANGVGYWHRQQFIRPDFTLSEGAKSIIPHVRRLQEGLHEVRQQAQWDHGGVAMRYDPDAILGRYYDHEAVDRIGRAEENWCAALDGVSAPYDVIAQQQILEGQLIGGEYRVLIMPAAITLSDREADILRRFVREGGVLLADHTVGLMDENCVWRDRGALDDVLGIKARSGIRPKPGDTRIVPVGDGLLAGLRIPAPVVETDLVLAPDAEALAEAGDDLAFWSHAYGEGRAFVLNVAMSRRTDNEHLFNPIMRRMLHELAVNPEVKAEPGHADKSAIMPRVTRRKLGKGYLIGAQNWESEEVALVSLPRPMHVYGLAQAEYLGKVQKITTHADEHFYAALPYRVTGLSLTGPRQVKAGEPLQLNWDLRIEGPDPTHRQVVNLKVFDENNQPLRHYMRNVVFDDGQGQAAIVTALNESAALTVVATEPISGVSDRCTIEVVERVTDPPLPAPSSSAGADAGIGPPSGAWTEPDMAAPPVPTAVDADEPAQALPNLIRNPQLAEPDEYGVPRDWAFGFNYDYFPPRMNRRYVKIDRDTTVRYQGRPTTRIAVQRYEGDRDQLEAKTHSRRYWWWLRQDLTEIAEKHDRLMLSLDLWFEQAPEDAGWRIVAEFEYDQAVGPDGKKTEQRWIEHFRFSEAAAGHWHHLKMPIEIPRATRKLELKLYCREPSQPLTFWITDLRLTPQGTGEPAND